MELDGKGLRRIDRCVRALFLVIDMGAPFEDSDKLIRKKYYEIFMSLAF